jgi:hypothetical protein
MFAAVCFGQSDARESGRVAHDGDRTPLANDPEATEVRNAPILPAMM